jgi:hypothetical protein
MGFIRSPDAQGEMVKMLIVFYTIGRKTPHD